VGVKVTEAARRLGRSPSGVRRLIDEGQIRAHRVKGQRVIEEADVEAFLRATSEATNGPTSRLSEGLPRGYTHPPSGGLHPHPLPGTPLEVEPTVHSSVHPTVEPSVEAMAPELRATLARTAALRQELAALEAEEAREELAEDLRIKRRQKLLVRLVKEHGDQWRPLLESLPNEDLEHPSRIDRAMREHVRAAQEQQRVHVQPAQVAQQRALWRDSVLRQILGQVQQALWGAPFAAHVVQQVHAAIAQMPDEHLAAGYGMGVAQQIVSQAQQQIVAQSAAAQRAAEIREAAALAQRQLEEWKREDERDRAARRQAEEDQRMRAEIEELRAMKAARDRDRETAESIRALAARMSNGGDGGGWADFARGFVAPAPAAPTPAPTATEVGVSDIKS